MEQGKLLEEEETYNWMSIAYMCWSAEDAWMCELDVVV